MTNIGEFEQMVINTELLSEPAQTTDALKATVYCCSEVAG